MKQIQAQCQLNLGQFKADFQFSLPGSGITALFGRSGSGKTSILRWMAGLTKASESFLSVGDDIIEDSLNKIHQPAHQRDFGFVFQDAALFPHLSVRENLDFALKRSKVTKRREALDQAVALWGVGSLFNRRTHELSGGEKQRVALARSWIGQPRLLLMDEPMSGLDDESKAEILPFFKKLKSETQIPVIYVSHSLQEVTALADHILLVQKGKVLSQGSSHEMLPILRERIAHIAH